MKKSKLNLAELEVNTFETSQKKKDEEPEEQGAYFTALGCLTVLPTYLGELCSNINCKE
ncbi:MAG: hypothetical protein ACEPO8_11325 [Rhodothermaceae bacterium]